MTFFSYEFPVRGVYQKKKKKSSTISLKRLLYPTDSDEAGTRDHADILFFQFIKE